MNLIIVAGPLAVFRRIDDAGCRIGGGGEDDEGGPHVVVYWRWLMAARDSFFAWPTLGTCTCDYSPPPPFHNASNRAQGSTVSSGMRGRF